RRGAPPRRRHRAPRSEHAIQGQDRLMAENSSIIVCDQKFDVGRRVITWQDDPAISAYTPHCVSKPDVIYPWSPAKGLGQNAMRFRSRRVLGADRSLSRLQQVLKQ